MNTNDELLTIEDDQQQKSTLSESKDFYKVLIVDDEKDVHLITRLALEDTKFLGKNLTFLEAYSGQEAKDIMKREKDIALIFLDVVMETNDAGLEVVEYIRNELNNWLVRIILRTGQTGQAPERDVISHYDINDYKAKTELTVIRLFTTTLTSLRTYKQLNELELFRASMQEKISS